VRAELRFGVLVAALLLPGAARADDFDPTASMCFQSEPLQRMVYSTEAQVRVVDALPDHAKALLDGAAVVSEPDEADATSVVSLALRRPDTRWTLIPVGDNSEFASTGLNGVSRVDLTGDGVPEIAVELLRGSHTRLSTWSGSSGSTTTDFVVLDPARDRMLIRVTRQVGFDVQPPRPCTDGTCDDGTLTAKERAELLCDSCATSSQSEERNRIIGLRDGILEIGPDVFEGFDRSRLDGDATGLACPEGRFAWASGAGTASGTGHWVVAAARQAQPAR